MKQFKAIFWDNDGVLVDTESLYYQACKRALGELGIDLTPAEYSDRILRQDVGIWSIAEERGVAPDKAARLREWRDQMYEQSLAAGNLTMPGAREVLSKLQKHYRMALVTTSLRRRVELMHRSTELLGFFEFVIVREDCEQCKPHPEPYLQAMRRMNLEPHECLVIEDSERGLIAAKRAGMACWVIPHDLNRAGDFSLADKVLDRLDNVVQLLGGDAPTIRRATNADLPAIRSLVFGVLRESGLQPDPAATDADLADLEAHYFARGGCFAVLEDSSGVIGSVGIDPKGDGVCELRKMYLSAAHRGRGLGKLLLEHGLSEARRLGFRRVVLETASVLKEAIRLYEHYGFRPFKPSHLAARCDRAMFLELS